MEKKDKGFESYEPPKLEVLEIMVEQAVLQASGYGPDRAHLQSSVFKLSKDLIDSIHEEGIVAYTS